MRRVVSRRIRRSGGGVNVVADVNVVVVTGSDGTASARQHARVVQRRRGTPGDRPVDDTTVDDTTVDDSNDDADGEIATWLEQKKRWRDGSQG